MSAIYMSSVLLIGCVAGLGLWVGAWLGRVVHALPLALEAAWQAQLADIQREQSAPGAPTADSPSTADASAPTAGSPSTAEASASTASSSSTAQSSAPTASSPSTAANEATAPSLTAPVPCAACGTVAHGWRSWPGFAAVFAPSHCEACGQSLPRYHRHIAWLTALVLACCAWRFGYGSGLVFAGVFCAVLIVLAYIDAQTTLLPDVLTLPLLWMGLLVNSGAGWVPLSHAVWGAALGYGGLWLVYHAFRLVTGREGMGYGDFKLLAALGAWLGIALLPWILLAASLAGVVVGLTLRVAGRTQPGQPLPFGPYLSAAGIIAMLWFANFPG